MKIYYTQNSIFGSVTVSGVIADATAGEAITALDVVYIKASDGLLYRLNTGVSEVNTAIVLMALEDIASGGVGRAILSGTVEESGFSYSLGNRITVPSSSGQPSEEVEA